MNAKLSLHDSSLSQEDITELTRRLQQDINQETDLTAAVPETPGGLGAKGDVSIIGQILLAALSSGTVVALFQVLKSYVERKPTLRLELKTPDGRELMLAAEHFSAGQIEQTIQAAKQFCKD